MKKYIKIVREIPEHYEVNTNMANKPWVKSYKTVTDTDGYASICARVYDTRYYDAHDPEEVERYQSRLERDAAENQVEPDYDQVKLIYKGVVTFDDDFVAKVNNAVTECRSFGEFAFATRKEFRKETISRLGTDREKKSFVRWALESR